MDAEDQRLPILGAGRSMPLRLMMAMAIGHVLLLSFWSAA
jgi:hypothetical protein